MSLAPRVIDARGLACPQPVILTRKALAEGGPGRILVIVDSPASRENVVRFATHAGCAVERVEESGDEARILIRPSGSEALPPPAGAPCDAPGLPKVDPDIRTLLLTSGTLGRGDDELGALLMRGFLYTLTESGNLPRRLILMNGGVLLAVEGSEHLVNLQRLAGLGVEILACGTCLEFHKVREKLSAGRVTNMQEIAGCLLEGQVLGL